MKPFKAQCNEVKRKGYITKKVTKLGVYMDKIVNPKLCEEQIWFEPSLKKGVYVGKCKFLTHNPVYKIVEG